MREIVRDLIQKYDLTRISGAIAACFLPGIRITKTDHQDFVPGASRIGGLPDVPSNFKWPQSEGYQLSFLAQLNCKNLAPFDGDRVLPAQGILYFFYDIIEQPWGCQPFHRDGSAVVYVEDVDELIQAEPPQLIKAGKLIPRPFDGEGLIIRPFNLEFETIPTIPSYEAESFLRRFTSDHQKKYWELMTSEEVDAYIRLMGELEERFRQGQPLHQLLGNSTNLQGDMQMKCQVYSSGIPYNEELGFSALEAQALRSGASEWRLLFQLDSDQDLDVTWGDTGMIYFWIRESNLKKHQFDQPWTILQC